MTRHHRTKNHARLLRSLYMWHRWIGLAAALFVIILSVTGLLLNHTEELALDSRYVTSPVLLEWYGIEMPQHSESYRAGDALVTGLDDRIYIDAVPLAGVSGQLAGALAWRDMLVVALDQQILLLTPAGELIEQLAAPGRQTYTLGLDNSRNLVIRTAQGLFVSAAELLDWQPSDNMDVTWSTPVQPDGAARQALEQAWHGNGLPLERVLLDLHSGRLLGRAGVYLMDGAAVILLLLAASGFWLWARRRASAREHQRKIRHRDSQAG